MNNHKLDLISQNERQVARDLKEIWSLNLSEIEENKEISDGNNSFWTPNEATTLTYYISFSSLESEQHEYGNNLEMKFCDLSLILWEQVSNNFGMVLLFFSMFLTRMDVKWRIFAIFRLINIQSF